jgi:predicted NUDIX family NTP pyrophosphohydrolase
MYRRVDHQLEVFLVHPGGPYFRNRHAGVWSVPKGVIEDGEEPIAVARREFEEETGQAVDRCAHGTHIVELGEVTQRGGKRVRAWAFEGDWPEGATLQSNTFEMEWPPKSGQRREFPEVDRGRFFDLDTARTQINEAQAAFIDRLLEAIG